MSSQPQGFVVVSFCVTLSEIIESSFKHDVVWPINTPHEEVFYFNDISQFTWW